MLNVSEHIGVTPPHTHSHNFKEWERGVQQWILLEFNTSVFAFSSYYNAFLMFATKAAKTKTEQHTAMICPEKT